MKFHLNLKKLHVNGFVMHFILHKLTCLTLQCNKGHSIQSWEIRFHPLKLEHMKFNYNWNILQLTAIEGLHLTGRNSIHRYLSYIAAHCQTFHLEMLNCILAEIVTNQFIWKYFCDTFVKERYIFLWRWKVWYSTGIDRYYISMKMNIIKF